MADVQLRGFASMTAGRFQGGILMHTHAARLLWTRNDQPFVDNRYSRVHRIEFDGGEVLKASSSPHVVRVPFSDPAAVDPEEMFVASLSSCHLLWFLSIAAQRGYCVDEYRARPRA